MLSEVEIALSSFNDIVGENLLVVDNAKKGTTKEVRSAFQTRYAGSVRCNGILFELVCGDVCVCVTAY